jgi:AcrR family transcriptional regulator
MNDDSLKKIRRGRNSLSQGEILDAAEFLLAKDGISNLSMRKIANRLGCSVASPYAYFDSIEDIARGLVLRGEDTLKKKIKEQQSISHPDSFSQLEAVAIAYWDFAREHRELHRLMFQVGEGILHRKMLHVIPSSYRLFLTTIKEGIEKGEFKYERKDYPGLARTIWAWIYGLIVLDLTGILHVRKERNDPLKEGIHFFRQLLGAGPIINSL